MGSRSADGPQIPRSHVRDLPGREPIDGLARRVTAKGDQPRDPRLAAGESQLPIATWKFFGRRQDDLTGRRRGLLTVVGCAAVETRYRLGEKPKRKSRSGTAWVVRCVCGVYGIRRTKSLKNPGPDACSQCRAKGLVVRKQWPA